MVKPPRTMQPESVDLKKAGRGSNKAFQDDSFHNYMARKISLQRQQFGLLLPPNPKINIIQQQQKQQCCKEYSMPNPSNNEQQQQQQEQKNYMNNNIHNVRTKESEMESSSSSNSMEELCNKKVPQHQLPLVMVEESIQLSPKKQQLNNASATATTPTTSILFPKQSASSSKCIAKNHHLTNNAISKKSKVVRFAFPTESTIITTITTNPDTKDTNRDGKNKNEDSYEDNNENDRYNDSHRRYSKSKKRRRGTIGCILKKLQQKHGKVSTDKRQKLSRSVFYCSNTNTGNTNNCNSSNENSGTVLDDDLIIARTEIEYEGCNSLENAVVSSKTDDDGRNMVTLLDDINYACNYGEASTGYSNSRGDTVDVENTASNGLIVDSLIPIPSNSLTVVSKDHPFEQRKYSNNVHANNEIVSFVSASEATDNSNSLAEANESDTVGDPVSAALQPLTTKVLHYQQRSSSSLSSSCLSLRQLRPDLFFMGVVVIVNGYTNPDTETIQRLLHKHGGDLERYETSRVTHIIAEHLSAAKAKMYKNQRSPRPVCYPAWITDSVQAQKLLPAADYIIDEMKDANTTSIKSVTSFFEKQQPKRSIEKKKGLPSDYHSGKQCTASSLVSFTGLDNKSETNRTEVSIGDDSHEIIDVDCIQEIQTTSGEDVSIEKQGKYYTHATSGARAESIDLSSLGDPSRSHHMRQVSDEDSQDNCPMDCQNLLRDDDCESPVTQIMLPDHDVGKIQNDDGYDDTVGDINNTFARKLNVSTLQEASRPEVSSDRYINGRIRTVGTDPNFLGSFFAASRLSFIGSYKQRARQESPMKNASSKNSLTDQQSTRFVLHVDMDCFFAAVVLRNYPQYLGMPVAISHQGKRKKNSQDKTTKETNSQDLLFDSGYVPKDSSSECATCNYEARKAGVTKGMYLGRARELCPNLVVLQYDFEGYEEVSEQVSDILHLHAAAFNGFVEQVSCDEAYIELRIPVEFVSRTSKSSYEVVGQLAEAIRADIFETTQCTATVGVGTNKLLAKLATDHVKPNKSFVVTDHRHLLQSLKLRELNGIGYRLERKLAEENLITVQDVWDLADTDAEKELCRILGPGLGKKIFGFCQGKDDRAIRPAVRKTIGAECNYGVRFDGPYGVDHMIEGLAKEVEKRMNHVGVKGSHVTLKLKQRKPGAPPPPKFLGHGSCHNLSKSQSTPNSIATRNKDIIFEVAMKMFKDLHVPQEDIRGMGIVVSKLSADEGEDEHHSNKQSSILNWFNGHPDQLRSNDDDGQLSSQADADTNRKSSSDDREVIMIDCAAQTGSDEDEVDVVTVRRTALETTPLRPSYMNTGNSYDIALPSLSQIHMSQVKALPADMQRHIEARILEATKSIAADSKEDLNWSADYESGRGPRFRQTDVKRMLQLAAVKNGQKAIPGLDGQAVSLTQLGSLPLELQLQVANADQGRVGKPSNEKKQRKGVPSRSENTGFPEKRLHVTSSIAVNSACNEGNSMCHDKCRRIEINDKAGRTPLPDVGHQSNPRDFFLNNVQPLHVFMDENPLPCIDCSISDNASISHVIQFLSICVAENRLADVVVLLRSIRNRKNEADGWNTFGFETILNSVNELVKQLSGYSLDKDWLS